jgi:hypothetical protein
MPKYAGLSEGFRDCDSNPFCDLIASWFYRGVKAIDRGFEANGVRYVAKPGVDSKKAFVAIRAVLGSFEPKHEHKIAGCGSMLSEWFDREELPR